MNKKIFKYIFVILIVIILLFIWLLVKKNKKTETGGEGTEITPGLEIGSSTDTKIKTTPVLENKKKNIFVFNGLVKELEVPKNVKIIKKEKVEINDGIIDRIIESFGFDNEATIDENGLKFYQTKNYNEGILINKKTNSIEYTRDLTNFPLEVGKTEISQEKLKDQTKQILEEKFGLDQIDLSFNKEITEIPFILKNKEKVSFIELHANFMVNGYPLYTYKQDNSNLLIVFAKDGTLIKMVFTWPENIEKTEVYQQIKSLDEISQMPKTNFEIISRIGGYEDYENIDISLKEIENNFSIINAHFGFVNLPKMDSLTPSIILEGKSIINETTIYITLAAPIFK